MQVYKVRKRYENAIAQGRRILAVKALKHGFEDAVRVEISACLDFLGRSEEAERERMAVGDDAFDNEPVDGEGFPRAPEVGGAQPSDCNLPN